MKSKAILAIVCYILLLFVLSGCTTHTIVNPETNIEYEIQYGLYVVKRVYAHGDASSIIAYDPKTNVCYFVVDNFRRAGITPYYIIGEDGTPEIAVYGKNYKGE